MDALLFDCDGVLAETERDGHRVAFNRAFAEFGLDVHWSPARYGALLAVAGGKQRLRRYFDEAGWPSNAGDRGHADDPDRLIAGVHARKTEIFREIVQAGEMPPRPGVVRLADAALAAGIAVAVCSTSDAAAVRAVVETVLGPERARRIGVFAGDAVAAKKPDPAVYTLALSELGAAPERSVAVEDSRNGLLAAKAAGLACVVTPSAYTAGDYAAGDCTAGADAASENFREADLVVPDLGDGSAARVALADCRALCRGSLS